MDWARFWWTFGVAAVCVLCFALMWLGWRNRGKRQASFPALPATPADLGPELTEQVSGVYISTTKSGRWQDRIVVHTVGRRAKADLHLYAAGVVIDRVGEDEIFIPATSLTGVSSAPGVAGKVMGTPDGILLLSWTWGAEIVDSGIRPDDLYAQIPWTEAAEKLMAELAATNSKNHGATT